MTRDRTFLTSTIAPQKPGNLQIYKSIQEGFDSWHAGIRQRHSQGGALFLTFSRSEIRVRNLHVNLFIKKTKTSLNLQIVVANFEQRRATFTSPTKYQVFEFAHMCACVRVCVCMCVCVCLRTNVHAWHSSLPRAPPGPYWVLVTWWTEGHQLLVTWWTEGHQYSIKLLQHCPSTFRVPRVHRQAVRCLNRQASHLFRPLLKDGQDLGRKIYREHQCYSISSGY